MSTRHKPWVRRLLFWLSYLFFKVTSRIPLCAARLLGDVLALIAYHIVPRIKKVGRANLELAYGDTLSDAEKERILRQSVTNLGRVAVEFSRMPQIALKKKEGLICIRGFDKVDLSQGGIMLGAHLGNWEWLMPAGASLGLKLVVVVREFDDARMNAVINKVRCDCGVKTIAKNAAMGPLMRKIREGWQVGLLADQSPRESAIPVTFFGQQTWATAGPALIAMRARAPIYPVSLTRDDRGRYTLEFFPAVPMVKTGAMRDDLQVNTQRCQDALESMIRKQPGQWLWFHRRWKKRERLEQEWQARTLKKQGDPVRTATKE